MATPVKAFPNLAKNMTRAERAAREAAEREAMPERATVKLVPPGYVKSDARAKRYWVDTLARMDGITLLDDLDTEMLGLYCSALARRDELHELSRKVMRDAKKQKLGPDDMLEVVSKLDTLTGKLQRQEAQLLQFADKLGLTPSGRVRLARKRAEARAVEEDDDLYGD